jgi:predicted FMN-binding regulatory protein PaiB
MEFCADMLRVNSVWKEVGDGEDVLVIFRATDAYISPNWYPSKHESDRQVPTWNYQVVNVHGKIRIVDDEKSYNAEVAKRCGLDDFENIRLEPIGIDDCAGETHEFHFQTRLMGHIVSSEAFEVREGNQAAISSN